MESAPALPKISAYCHLGPVVVDRASSIGCEPPRAPRLADVPLPTLPAYASAHPLAAPLVQYIILLKYNQPSIKCSGRYVQYVSSPCHTYMQTKRCLGHILVVDPVTNAFHAYIQLNASIIYYVLVYRHHVREVEFFAQSNSHCKYLRAWFVGKTRLRSLSVSYQRLKKCSESAPEGVPEGARIINQNISIKKAFSFSPFSNP